MNKKIGLFFGSFNPIHVGHLIIAEYIVEHSDLKELWFVVSPCNPLKKKQSLLGERQRLYMVNLAIEDDMRFRASDIEFKLPQPSYTVHTLTYLAEKYPDKEFCLIMGEDNLDCIEKWYNYQFILDNYQIYVYPRDNYKTEKKRILPNITYVNAPKMEISATMIREGIKEKKSVRYLMPEKVAKYVEEMGFYRN
ncbi:MAG: nicotinate-nucleotide adenylyltransferase [Bacteroidales bacterium]|nr:nicotinate-nucleotide adenylyltransferase [Bacteroidales bacterium]